MQFVEPRLREDRISTQPAAVDLRYSDLPESISLVVPTAEGFAGMKLMAWHQRQAPRDLCDLVALADICAITELAIGLTQEVTGARIDARAIDHELPGTVTNRWSDQLAHQMTTVLSAEECLRRVVRTLRAVDESAEFFGED